MEMAEHWSAPTTQKNQVQWSTLKWLNLHQWCNVFISPLSSSPFKQFFSVKLWFFFSWTGASSHSALKIICPILYTMLRLGDRFTQCFVCLGLLDNPVASHYNSSSVSHTNLSVLSLLHCWTEATCNLEEHLQTLMSLLCHSDEAQ